MFSKILGLILLVSLGAFGFYYYKMERSVSSPTEEKVSVKTPIVKPDGGVSPESLCESQGGTYSYEVNECVLPLIVVTKPESGALISSPLNVSGKARGYWYFEASFPLEITDSSGVVLAIGHANAKADWMTKEYVSFDGSVTFSVPKGGDNRGFVVFKKDNPSGLPENDDFVRVPVRFRP